MPHRWPSSPSPPHNWLWGHFNWSWCDPTLPLSMPKGVSVSNHCKHHWQSLPTQHQQGWKAHVDENSPKSQEPQFHQGISHQGHCREPSPDLGMKILLYHHLNYLSHLALQVNAQQFSTSLTGIKKKRMHSERSVGIPKGPGSAQSQLQVTS